MQPRDVTAYGCDYSVREFTPDELNRYPGVRIDWLARYIGYPGNPKCISAYPGAYRRHRDAGRPVVLYHQVAYRDFEGGYESGRMQAQTAMRDARSVGWEGETPILACFDRRMPAFTRGGITYRAIWLDEVRSYVSGFRSVIGYDNSGFYGFEDTMKPCVEENWVRFRMQCGARSAHIPGIQAWQENNEQPYLLGIQTDRLELYIALSDIGGDDMALSEAQNAALDALAPGKEGVRNSGETFNLLVENNLLLTRVAAQQAELLGRPAADVDEAALAAELLRLGLSRDLSKIPQDQLELLAKVTNDEADRRARARANVNVPAPDRSL